MGHGLNVQEKDLNVQTIRLGLIPMQGWFDAELTQVGSCTEQAGDPVLR